ncbi:Catechol 2,3-dioxygenase [Bifidobacterium bohemicum]|uniref:Glyoxalase/bleomycin resistance protein/dioxygenase n=1 Tax=Bifidobacterium bohemicum DSM 22767 TaxID=1437606 RepID=A0A086ZGA8_9BIFI|nr:VOC family protein [Bifidobacterium bohemicum]KFI45558.1 Glyoxalase/bleomycin resistance protein/dioxygenase [Bifidobacterium bohemicum DSM 22767]SCC01917.1 Catechol 2,3-dioxygenase [Bifidobacterium bohemicum]
MIGHIGVYTTNFDAEKAFYAAALAPLGYVQGAEFPGAVMFADESDGDAVWIESAQEGTAPSPIHLAFAAPDKAAVAAFHEAGLKAGGTDNGEPGPRPNYGPDYYAAFVHDPDGNNIEAVINK